MQRNCSVLLRIVALAISGIAYAGDVTISGFLSTGGGFLDDASKGSYAGYSSEDFLFDADTLVGIQVTGNISEKITATAQLVSRGINDYEVDAEWAYISYQATDNFRWRMGRLRMPLYNFSDYLDVGYAYHWIRAPKEVYYLPFNNIQGLDFVWNYTMGPLDGSVQAYYGAFTDTYFNTDLQSEISTQSRNHKGIALTLGGDWLTLRFARHEAELSLSGYEGKAIAPCVVPSIGPLCQAIGLTAPGDIFTVSGLHTFLSNQPGGIGDLAAADLETTGEDDGSFNQFGYTIDTGVFVSTGEWVEFEIVGSPFSLDKRWYVLVGARIGDFLFHVTKAEAEDEAADLTANLHPALAGLTPIMDGIAAGLVDEHETMSYGVRWDFSNSTAFKLQIDSLKNFQPDDQKVISFAIQSVF